MFELSATGQETVLHAFTGQPDGEFPYGSLVLDSAGNLYGVTQEGETSQGVEFGCGTVFKISR
ncbi:MAG TPA: choice-of-anchor tandem repeat GloVer-containing protein [Terriglobia bacterium]|nr:choice-of-anchor tandem repeat GloVer-containing protein [Terriglobia bacterium]